MRASTEFEPPANEDICTPLFYMVDAIANGARLDMPSVKGGSKNPKLIHRIYFPNFKPFEDPFLHYLESWQHEMPDYEIKLWGPENLSCDENDWVRRAAAAGAPVFLAEYYRWKILSEYGGIYLDADCEIVDGKVLRGLIDELYAQNDYDVFFGVEERSNGHPTAQTVAARPGSDLVRYMKSLYEDTLSPLWEWRERRGLIGPQLMALYFLNKGINVQDDGLFKWLDEPIVVSRAKVYPQTYFSPKFSINGSTLSIEEGKTCVYHMFANSNLDFPDDSTEGVSRNQALTFAQYRARVTAAQTLPLTVPASRLPLTSADVVADRVVVRPEGGVASFGPYITLEAGDYVAGLIDVRLPTAGSISLSITVGGGASQIALTEFDLAHGPARLAEVAFELTTEARQVELVVGAAPGTALTYSGIRIERRSDMLPRSLKKLHRIYFGFDGKPDPFRRYLDTWRTQLPDFEIIMWDATNLPVEINEYTRRLYAEQNHAFLTDYFRWHVLREHGGVYLDADVEVVNGEVFRGLIEELSSSVEFDALIGIDEKGGGWYTAHSMASKPQSRLARFMCNVYEDLWLFAPWMKYGFYFWAPQLVALYFSNTGHNIAGMGTLAHLDEPVVIGRVKVLPQDYFSPIAPTGDAGKPFNINGYSENTAICHHFACTWHDNSSIYTAHSRAKGGQAGVLLMELLRDLESARFDPADGLLRTSSGTVTSQGISTGGQEGFLMYGPYVNVPPGDYEFEIGLRDVVNIQDMIIEVTAGKGAQGIAKFFASTVPGHPGSLRFNVTLDKMMHNVEVRAYVSAQTDLTISSVSYAPSSRSPDS